MNWFLMAKQSQAITYPIPGETYRKGDIIRSVDQVEAQSIVYAIYKQKTQYRMQKPNFYYVWMLIRHKLSRIEEWNRWVRGATLIDHVPTEVEEPAPQDKEYYKQHGYNGRPWPK